MGGCTYASLLVVVSLRQDEARGGYQPYLQALLQASVCWWCCCGRGLEFRARSVQRRRSLTPALMRESINFRQPSFTLRKKCPRSNRTKASNVEPAGIFVREFPTILELSSVQVAAFVKWVVNECDRIQLTYVLLANLCEYRACDSVFRTINDSDLK